MCMFQFHFDEFSKQLSSINIVRVWSLLRKKVGHKGALLYDCIQYVYRPILKSFYECTSIDYMNPFMCGHLKHELYSTVGRELTCLLVKIKNHIWMSLIKSLWEIQGNPRQIPAQYNRTSSGKFWTSQTKDS